jgi:hypothetical protein
MDSLLLKLFTHLHSTCVCVFHVPAELAGGHASSQPTNGACPSPQFPLIPPPAQRRPLSTHLHPHGSPRRGAGLRGVLPPPVALVSRADHMDHAEERTQAVQQKAQTEGVKEDNQSPRSRRVPKPNTKYIGAEWRV